MSQKIFYSFVPLLISVLYLLGVLSIPFGKISAPGPGLYPVLLGIVASGISLSIFIQELLSKKMLKEEVCSLKQKRNSHLKEVIGYIFAFLITIFFFETLGAVLSIFFLTLSLLKLTGVKEWINAIVISVILALLIFFIFDYLLKIDLPRGIFSNFF
ncbi:tripartite tricarboxylate transporter TctB family protein [Neomoorella humiferrea]|uniref:tripartite tricarboxylate transporter TctB family protein n=1 Tax=Neomoorella humiferrea TaxID=676965 RepID=UPI0030CEAF4B